MTAFNIVASTEKRSFLLYDIVVRCDDLCTKGGTQMDNRFDSKEKERGIFKRVLFLRREHELHIPEGEELVKGIGWGVTAFLLGICRLPLSVYPLGMAFLCASDTYIGFSLAGLALAAFFLPIPWGAYLAVIALTLLARILTRLFVDIPVRSREIVGLRGMLEHIRGRLFCESLYLRMTCSCVAVFMLSLYAIVAGGFRYYDLFGAFFAMLVAPVATFFYCSFSGDMPLSSVWLSRVRRVAKCLLAFSLCLSFGEMELAGISLGMAAAFVATLILCREEGLLLGLLTSLLCGFACGLSYFAIFPVIAITAFCLFEFSPYLSALVSFVIGGVTGVLLAGRDNLLVIFFPLMLGAAVYCSLERLLARRELASLFHKKGRGIRRELIRLERQHLETCEALLGLCHAFGALSQGLTLLGEELKSSMPKDALNFEKTSVFAINYSMAADAFSGLLEDVKAEYREDDKKTVAVRDKLRELGFEAEEVSICGGRNSRIFISGISPIPEHKKLLYLQKQLGRTLDCTLTLPTLTLEGGACLLYAECAACFEMSVGKASAAKEGVSGDSVSVFDDVRRHLSYSLISDGMGTGKEAALTSGISTELLTRLLEVGVAHESALRMLNSFLTLGRNSGSAESSTTVDLMCLDRLTGRALFLKSGASPTYVKRGTNIFKLTGATLPVGILTLVDAKHIEFDTRDGDIIIQSSDGVTQGESECLWLLEYLNATLETDPQIMAEHIKEKALSHGSQDDVSVVVIKIQQKN